ncbi:hypothetical protein Tco_1483222 [Tanacetum coccineum]
MLSKKSRLNFRSLYLKHSYYVKPRLTYTVKEALKAIPLPQPAATTLSDFTKLELKEKLYDIMFLSAPLSQKKQSHDDQDPPENCEGENKKRIQKYTSVPSSKKGKAQDDTSNFKRFEDADKPRHEQEQEHELVDADKEPQEHELQIGSTVMFGKCMKKFLNKDKITKADLKDRIDWTNPEGERFHNDMSKPLPLTG